MQGQNENNQCQKKHQKSNPVHSHADSWRRRKKTTTTGPTQTQETRKANT